MNEESFNIVIKIIDLCILEDYYSAFTFTLIRMKKISF